MRLHLDEKYHSCYQGTPHSAILGLKTTVLYVLIDFLLTKRFGTFNLTSYPLCPLLIMLHWTNSLAHLCSL